jgi:hypothetical protein
MIRKYAYKGYVYEVDEVTGTRQMRFRDTDNIYNLDQYGDITLEEFKSIVEQWLDW